ncbi:TPA: hypothetical protein PXI74_002136 [Yersinia enterocolitica]|nr:hypothetical protein [Yersinia enterocolitica]HDL6777255.1 hypothetical protein [Yersinia enterocolitica]HEM6605799.1 hypothetical protein [Yersinia enterocolitica]HEN3519216.1 hypothetical protein [Yersinia enterocolitica]
MSKKQGKLIRYIVLQLEKRGHYIAVALMIIFCFFFYKKYSFYDVKDILSTLQNISAMIFTIAGIWLAYIYPKAVTAIIKPSKITSITTEDDTLEDINRITMIVKIIVISASVTFLIILINILKPIFTPLSAYGHIENTLHYFGVLLVILLIYIQSIALFGIVSSTIIFLNDLHKKFNQRQLDKLR